MVPILTEQQVALSVKRLAHQIVENHLQLENTVIIGIQPRGVFLSDRIVHELTGFIERENIRYGKLDITFYRDDIRKELKIANKTDIAFSIENKNVVIIDDVNIGTGAIIAAGSIVTKDVPPYAIYGGVPARLIKMRFDEATIQALLASEWWQHDDAWFKEHYKLMHNSEDFLQFLKQEKKNG